MPLIKWSHYVSQCIRPTYLILSFYDRQDVGRVIQEKFDLNVRFHYLGQPVVLLSSLVRNGKYNVHLKQKYDGYYPRSGDKAR